MTVPEDFVRAYEDLIPLVGRIEAGGAPDPLVREEVDRWRADSCLGSASLTKAAILALRHELATEGLRENQGPEGPAARELRALARVQWTLSPPEKSTAANHEPEIVEVAPPEALAERMPGGRTFRMGEIQIIFNQTEEPPYGHLSVSHPTRYPTWEEILLARTAPGGLMPNLFVFVPKEDGSRDGTDSLTRRSIELFVAPPVELMG